MKILMPYVDISGGDISNKKISGGTELFSRLICDNFDVVVFPIPWTTDNKQNKQYQNSLIKTFYDEKCDLVLSNNFKSVCFYALRDLGIPIMHITHTNYGLANSNQIIAAVESHGHSIFGVSQFNIDYHQNKSKRLSIPELNYSGFLRPAYCSYDLPVETNPTDNVITIGRANTYKAPFIIYKALKESKYKPLVITSLGVDHDSVTYYERHKDKHHLIDLPHDQVIDHLRKSACSIITCTNETFGITALESLSVGTPVLIRTNDKGRHASEEIAATESHYRCFKTDADRAEIEQKLDELVKLDRTEIKEMTQEKHSKQKWVSEFSRAFDMTIEKYKKHKSKSDLNQFF